mgnify:CR=1 FL=1
MTRIDLYLLKGNTFSDQIDFCCRLTEKALPQHPKIFIQTAESIQNEALNNALWDFKAESFLPHIVGQEIDTGTSNIPSPPIVIDTHTIKAYPENKQSLLITLCKELPANYQQFKRLCLIVLNIEEDIQNARKLYKHIKRQGLEVHIQDMR